MTNKDYTIQVEYSAVNAGREAGSMDIFRELIKRGLEFSASVNSAPAG